MKNSHKETLFHIIRRYKIAEIILTVLILASVSYDAWEYWTLRIEKQNLSTDKEQYENLIMSLKKNLTDAKNENLALLGVLQTEQANNALFADQIRSITGTVGILDKLSKTDPELLKKYSKIYFLNENYVPAKLTDIDPKYIYNKDTSYQVLTEVWPHLQAMLEKALSENVNIQVISAYRSFGTQAVLKSGYKITYGTNTANKFSADQGYSEHQLGTTLDFTTPSVGTTFVGFEKTDAYKWLMAHAHEYGFTMSYPKENIYYTFEPWHFRFVGVALATRIRNENIYFYALDQREIDKYLANLFD